jgi:hypothetical protein
MKTPFYIKILLAISVIIIFAQQDLQSCTNKALIEATNKSDVLPDIEQLQLNSPIKKQAYNTSKLPAGSYTIEIKTSDYSYSTKLIVQ